MIFRTFLNKLYFLWTLAICAFLWSCSLEFLWSCLIGLLFSFVFIDIYECHFWFSDAVVCHTILKKLMFNLPTFSLAACATLFVYHLSKKIYCCVFFAKFLSFSSHSVLWFIFNAFFGVRYMTVVLIYVLYMAIWLSNIIYWKSYSFSPSFV